MAGLDQEDPLVKGRCMRQIASLMMRESFGQKVCLIGHGANFLMNPQAI
jgi:hypothetical protein